MVPDIVYTRTPDGTRIAYWVHGSGPPLLHMPDIPVAIDRQWEIPELRSWYETLAANHTVITYDPPGVGLSDRDAPDVSFDVGGHALEAVVEAVGLPSFDLLGAYRRTPNAIAFTARYPTRVSRLMLWCPHSAGKAVQQTAGHKAIINLFASDWKTFTEYVLRISTGLPAGRVTTIAEHARASISQAVYRRQAELQLKTDVTELLPRVVSPTLVIHRREVSMVTADFSRDVAARIPQSRLAFVEGESMYPYFGDQHEVLDVMERFLAEASGPRNPAPVATDGSLSARELEVLRLLGRGLTNQQIGAALHLSPHTVGHHVSNILHKIGARSRSEAAAYAGRMGLAVPASPE